MDDARVDAQSKISEIVASEYDLLEGSVCSCLHNVLADNLDDRVHCNVVQDKGSQR